MAEQQPVRLLRSTHQLVPNNTLTNVWMRPRVFSPKQCDALVTLAAQQPQTEASTDRPVEGLRDSRVTWLQPTVQTEWLFARLQAALGQVNRHYGFALKGFYEGAQIATYDSGGHYGWHMDIGQGIYGNRKFSMSLQLSDGQDYDGGDLQFRARTEPVLRERGSLIVFPSYLEHRVTPVTRGQRVSLVSWVAGPPFR